MIEIVKQILKNEKIDYTLLKKSEAGFSNEVYFIDDRYVLKICDGKKSHKLKKEITIYQNIKMENVPKYILHGEIEDKVYLIIEKIQGKSLYNVWHILSEEDRKHIIYLMCNILKEFSSQPHFYLEERYKSENWLQKWQKSFDINIPILKERNFDTALLEDFKANKLEKIMKQQNLKLLFNDAHFDNFILTNDKKLYLIDFDRVIYGSLDYELLILDSMLDNPFKFASLEEEAFVKEEDYKNIRSYLNEFYPELYDFKYINERVFLYKFFYKLGAGYEYDRNEWIKQDLEDFREYFYGKGEDNERN